jgi:putative transcriptional regulator
MNIVGNLLIAPPAVKGNFWYKTVIMVTEHDQNGSVGLVLNRRSQTSIVEFALSLGIHADIPGFVYVGGPINTKSLSFLHTTDWQSKNTMRINNEFSLSSADDILPRLAAGDMPERWRLFVGMCGWTQGQLIGEMQGKAPWNIATSWCWSNSSIDLVFGSDNKDQWCNALDRSGLEFAQNLLT